MTPAASWFVTLGIPALALGVLAFVALGIRASVGARSARGFVLGASAWLALSGALAASGFFARPSIPPPFLFLLAPTLLLPSALGFSRVGAAVASGLPISLLVGFHAFRLPLELVMHRAAAEGTMPPQMTFTGANFDVATGATALVVAGLAACGRAPRWLLFAWNALGSALLVAIVGIAIASLPVFHAFGREPDRLNTWVAHFPFVWLPAGLVAAALFGHIVLWRRLLAISSRA